MAESVKLTPEQEEAISEIDRNLQIIACAGSGKTEVITRRIANILKSRPGIKAENIVAFTFTEKAAESMKNRIMKALGSDIDFDPDQMYIGTIHGFCYHLLSEYSEQFRSIKILDTVKNHLFVERYCDTCGMSDLELEPYPRNIALFLQCIDKMIDDYDHSNEWTEIQRTAFEKYKNSLYNHGYIDFSLMIFETLKQIDSSSTVREYLSNIRYLVVDEYQDVNDLQEALIRRIADFGANVCVVGDDDQTIYQFRGSNADNMISFADHYSDVHQVRLEKNFRCSSEIVDIADKVIVNNRHRLAKKMVSGAPTAPSEIKAERHEDKEEEYYAIAREIKELHAEGIPYHEIAILVRKGKVINSAVNALVLAGIPFETDSAEHFFTGNFFRRFVRTLYILTEIDKAKLYECWCDILDDAAISIGFKYLRSCARGGRQRLSEILRGFCEKTDFLNEDAEDITLRRNDLDGFIKILDDYEEIYGDWQLTARINKILRFLDLQAEEEYKYHSFREKDPNIEAVQIMTVHKSKGLEFHTVFLPELMEREFPVGNMGGKQYWHVLGGVFEENKEKYQSDLEDERKLFYVAVTRAKRNLYMTYELTKQPVSCFVRESAKSQYLQINKKDLYYDPKAEKEKSKTHNSSSGSWSGGSSFSYGWVSDANKTESFQVNRDEERRRKAEYRATVKEARRRLMDYYGTAAQVTRAAGADLVRVSRMSDEEIIQEASKYGFI